MFRSLFIGLLILSALASKSAGIQIKQDISNITPEMLLELYNAFVFNTDQQAKNQDDDSGEAFFRHASFFGDTIETSGKSARQYSSQAKAERLIGLHASAERPEDSVRPYDPAIWIEAVNFGAAQSTPCTRISIGEKPMHENEIYQYGTGLSPPDYRKDFQA